VAVERGPEVRTQTLSQRLSDGPPSTITELFRFGGKVHDAEGEPVADAWVAMPDLGLLASTNREGRFIFNRVGPGKHRIEARTRDGGQAEIEVQIPGTPADLVIGAARKGKK
jgi:protocatechuate 3,4-dioxygenase beta subunit